MFLTLFSFVFVFYFFSASVEFCSLRVYTRAGLWHFVITCHGQLDTWASLPLSLYMWIPTNSLKFSQLLQLCEKFTPCPLCPTFQFSNQHQKYLCFVDMLIQFLLWLLRGYDLSNPHQLLKILTTSRKLHKIVSLSSLSHFPV